MSATITRNADAASTTPTLVLGYETRREGRNTVHDLIGGGIAVALANARPRAGTLTLFYPHEADAWAALALFDAETTFTLTSTDRPSIGMTFVTMGSDLALDDRTRDHWQLDIEYQEVIP